MNKVYLLIGGNIGDRLENIQLATNQIQKQCGNIVQYSSLYETEAWGYTDQPLFLNQALLLETTLGATELMQQFLAIELNLGRKRHEPLGPRTIDIDIIYFNDEIISNDNLTIPHPRMAQRNFVLIPICEIAPDYIHPLFNLSNSNLLKECGDKSHVYKKHNNKA